MLFRFFCFFFGLTLIYLTGHQHASGEPRRMDGQPKAESTPADRFYPCSAVLQPRHRAHGPKHYIEQITPEFQLERKKTDELIQTAEKIRMEVKGKLVKYSVEVIKGLREFNLTSRPYNEYRIRMISPHGQKIAEEIDSVFDPSSGLRWARTHKDKAESLLELLNSHIDGFVSTNPAADISQISELRQRFHAHMRELNQRKDQPAFTDLQSYQLMDLKRWGRETHVQISSMNPDQTGQLKAGRLLRRVRKLNPSLLSQYFTAWGEAHIDFDDNFHFYDPSDDFKPQIDI